MRLISNLYGFGVVTIGYCLRSVVSHHRDAVVVQHVQGQTHTHAEIRIGTAQGQPSHHVGDSAVILGLQLQGTRRIDRSLVVHEHHTVAVADESAGAAGKAQGIVRLARGQDDTHLIHVVFGMKGNVDGFCIFVIIILGASHGHFLAHQDQAVAGKLLYADAGSYAVAVGLGETEILRSVTRAAYHVHFSIRVNGYALARANSPPLTHGRHALVLELGDIEGNRHRQLVLVVIRYIAAGVVIRVGSGVHHVGNGSDQSLGNFKVGIYILRQGIEVLQEPLCSFGHVRLVRGGRNSAVPGTIGRRIFHVLTKFVHLGFNFVHVRFRQVR